MAVPAVPRFEYNDLGTASKMQSLSRVEQFLMGGGTDGRPALRLGNTTPQEIPNDEETTLLWNSKIFDNRGMWSADNPGDIVFQEDGIYLVAASCEFFGSGAGVRDLWFELDGIEDGGAKGTVSGATDETRQYTGLIMATAGSTLHVQVRQTSGGDLNTGLGHFNPRLNVFFLCRLAGQSPAFDAEDQTELPPNLQAAFDGINAQLVLIGSRLSALEAVAPVPPPEQGSGVTTVVRINAGGPAFTGADGVTWEADRGATGGEVSLQGSNRTYGTQHDPLFFSERWGAFTYAIPNLPVGAATVNLYFAENHTPTNAANLRKFNVAVNGTSALANYDIYAQAGGHQYTPVTASVSTTIPTTGICTIVFSLTGSTNNAATVQGIEIICTGTTHAPDPDPGDPGTPATPTGFWRSGVNGHRQSEIDAWVAFRKRPVDFQLTYTTRTGSWDDLVGPTYATEWPDKSRAIIIAQPFTPNSVGASANGAQARAIATKAYDAQWRRWGQLLAAKKAAGYVEYVTELAWEFNGNWMFHSAVNATEFVAAWRRIVDIVREVHPTAEFAWTVNAGYSQNPPSHNAQDCWPGDAYVNYVGVDLYDHYPPAIGYAAVETREENNTGRARYWANFAAAHGKKMIFPEWGLNHRNGWEGIGGGDNPGYIQWMYDFFSELWAAGRLYGETYFNNLEQNNVWSDLLGSRNPQSSLKYRQLWLPPQP